MDKKFIGNTGEDIAVEYLSGIGYKIIKRNDKRRGVEADILAQDKDQKVVVEVKTKTGLEYGLPQEMVTKRKQGQLIRYAKSLIADFGWQNLRIDIVAVDLSENEPKIEHLINAVEGRT